jgi:hypothetical protein
MYWQSLGNLYVLELKFICIGSLLETHMNSESTRNPFVLGVFRKFICTERLQGPLMYWEFTGNPNVLGVHRELKFTGSREGTHLY